jgi:hypothetical protein
MIMRTWIAAGLVLAGCAVAAQAQRDETPPPAPPVEKYKPYKLSAAETKLIHDSFRLALPQDIEGFVLGRMGAGLHPKGAVIICGGITIKEPPATLFRGNHPYKGERAFMAQLTEEKTATSLSKKFKVIKLARDAGESLLALCRKWGVAI